MTGDPRDLGEFVRLFYPDADQGYVEAQIGMLGKMEERRRFAVLTKGFSVQEQTISTAQLVGNHPDMILIDDPWVGPFTLCDGTGSTISLPDLEVLSGAWSRLGDPLADDIPSLKLAELVDVERKRMIDPPIVDDEPINNRAARRRAAAQARKRR